VRLEWDDDKRAVNLARHGVGFADAARSDWDAALEVENARYDYGERRWRALGPIDGRLHALVYARRGDAIRAISLRKANAREERLHAGA
jgi:uncharacterized DUF497 family protein